VVLVDMKFVDACGRNYECLAINISQHTLYMGNKIQFFKFLYPEANFVDCKQRIVISVLLTFSLTASVV
jgi:hypothetical protein